MWHHATFSLAILTLQSLFLVLPVLATTEAEWEVRPLIHLGFETIPAECIGEDFSFLTHSMEGAKQLALAAINAASNFKELPFIYFFKGDAETADTVLGVLRRAQKSFAGRSALISATCKDVQNRCRDGDDVKVAYTIQERNRAPIIVFCPPALGAGALRGLPKACIEPPIISLGWVMLHEMVQLYHISGPALDIEEVNGADGESARDVYEAAKAGIDSVWDANAYAYLGEWAWSMGLGGSSPDPKEFCANNFYRGDFLVEGMKAVALGHAIVRNG